MPSVTKTVDLGVPPDQAFALATDPARYEEWLTLHRSWPNGVPESTAAGSEFVQQLVIMGMPSDINWKVEEHRAPERFVIRGSGPMGTELATTISASAADQGTTLAYEAVFEGGAIQGPLGDMVAQKAGEELETSLAKLRELAA